MEQKTVAEIYEEKFPGTPPDDPDTIIEPEKENLPEEKTTDDRATRAWNALDIEIVEDEPPEDGSEEPEKEKSTVDVDALKAKLAALEAQVTAGKTTDAITEGFEALTKRLETLGTTTAGATAKTEAQQFEESYEELKKKLSDTYYDAPIDTVDQLMDRKLREMVGPALLQLQQQIHATTQTVTKREAASDSTGKFVLEKYPTEVETLVGAGKTYTEAVNQVAMNHLTDIIEAQVKERTEAAKEENKDDLPPAKNASPTQTKRAAPAPDGKVRMTRKLQQELKNEALVRGVNEDDYIRYVKRTAPERFKRK